MFTLLLLHVFFSKNVLHTGQMTCPISFKRTSWVLLLQRVDEGVRGMWGGFYHFLIKKTVLCSRKYYISDPKSAQA